MSDGLTSLNNLKSINPVNPFQNDLDDIYDIGNIAKVINNKIHIRLRQRNARKTITSVEGLEEELDFKRILSTLRKSFHCRGSSVIDPATELTILELSGDQRNKIKSFLIGEKIAEERDIIMHGY